MTRKTITCLSCGETGRNEGRQLCTRCYNRARALGTYRNYPECGALPVPRLTPTTKVTVSSPPTVTALEMLIPLPRDWKPGTWGARTAPKLGKVDAYNQRRATEWLAQREQAVA